jgi:hypothetical protein
MVKYFIYLVIKKNALTKQPQIKDACYLIAGILAAIRKYAQTISK